MKIGEPANTGSPTSALATRMKSKATAISSDQLLELALAGCFGLLLALDRRLLVSLALTDLCEHTAASSAALEATQCAFQRLALFNTNFRHLIPSLGP